MLPVRKLHIPPYAEVRLGVVASGGITMPNRKLGETLDLPKERMDVIIGWGKREIEGQEEIYSKHLITGMIQGMTVFLVHVGMATGITMDAALTSLPGSGLARS